MLKLFNMSNSIKRLSLLLWVLQPLYSYAQFNTISPYHVAKHIETNIDCGNAINKQVDKANVDLSTIAFNTNKKQSSSMQDLLRQYLSVSYPLNHIKVNSPFGMRLHPIDKIDKMHYGIDLKAESEEVYAMMDGEIIKVGYDKTSGHYITIKHKGNLTVSYCHLARPLVTKGLQVTAGEVVAISGNSGKSTNFHLHITVKQNGKDQNPFLFLQHVNSIRKDVLEKIISMENT